VGIIVHAPMNTKALEPSQQQVDSWIAAPRFEPFFVAASYDQAKATQLYVWNARLASACFEVIHHLEVLVRNAMHRELKADEHDGTLRSWLIDPKFLKHDELRAVEDTVARIKKRRRSVTENRVIGGMSFGFWPSLVGTSYDELWKATLHRAFPHGSGKRRDVAGPLNRVWQLRNNVAHHEAIFQLPIAAAIDPDAGRWIAGTSQVLDVLSQRP
jgi:hypothetical protein